MIGGVTMPVIKWQGRDVDGLEVRFRSNHEEWNDYTLEDGSNIRMKAVVSEIVRLDGEYDGEGNPVYLVKSTNVMVIKAPDNLKRGAQNRSI
jgi:hypothetical protein